ncbi:MAG: hypothetical protein ABIR62_05345 [Dokdonella sp.]|uniref:hypothetical protein n=1 Tax=Dokdonella sp. TaxID=2291710 RepID=UPI0032676DDC
MPATLVVIVVLLNTAFNSMRHAALILADVPFATASGLWRCRSQVNPCRSRPRSASCGIRRRDVELQRAWMEERATRRLRQSPAKS